VSLCLHDVPILYLPAKRGQGGATAIEVEEEDGGGKDGLPPLKKAESYGIKTKCNK